MSSSSIQSTHIHQRHMPFISQYGDQANTAKSRSVDLTTVQRELLALTHSVNVPDQAQSELARYALELTNADSVSYFSINSGKPELVAGANVTNQPSQTRLDDEVAQLSVQSITENTAKVSRSQTSTLVSVPVAVNADQRQALTAALSVNHGDVEPFVVSLQMVAAYTTLWWQRQVQRDVDWQADALAGIVEIVAEIERAPGLDAACIVMVNKLHELVQARHVAVGLTRMSGSCIELRAISERPQVDAKSDTARSFENAMNESMLHAAPALWPPTDPGSRAALLAHQKLAEQFQAPTALTIPLTTENGEALAAITVLGEKSVDASRLTAFSTTAAPYFASALRTAQRLEGGRLQKITRSLVCFSVSRKKQIATVAILLTAVLLFPVRHKIACDGTVEASARRFVVAPYAGVLKETFVKPGDVVSRNQLLARMDDREINWELSGLVADRDRAAKEHDIALSNNETAKMQMSGLEVERNNLKIQLLQHRKDNLEIRAAVSGVVLRGDVEGIQGAPVETGQALFEVAPLDQLRLDVLIPDVDASYVQEGMPITFYLDALPNQELQGTVTRIHPQAEVIDAQNVFVVEVTLSQPADNLRPGMQGTGKVMGNRRPLAWILFHRPWEKLINFLR